MSFGGLVAVFPVGGIGPTFPVVGDGRRVGCKGTISKKLTHGLGRVHIPAAPAVSFGGLVPDFTVDSLGSAFPVGGLGHVSLCGWSRSCCSILLFRRSRSCIPRWGYSFYFPLGYTVKLLYLCPMATSFLLSLWLQVLASPVVSFEGLSLY